MDGWVAEARASTVARATKQILDVDAPVVWVHAPLGFGKLEVRDRLLHEGASPVDAATEHLLHNDVLAAVRLDTPERLVVFSRVGAPDAMQPCAVIGPQELALRPTPDESQGRSSFVLETANGWPAYAQALAFAGPDSSSASLVSRGPLTSELIDRCLADVDEEHLRVFSELAPLERISDRVVSALSSKVSLQSGLLSGLPLLQQRDGWHVLLEPVRTMLQAQSPTLDKAVAERIGEALVGDAGRVGAGLAFARAGRYDSARDLLSAMRPHELDEADQGQLRALLTALIDTEKDDGTLSLLLARAYFNRGALNRQRAALEAAYDTASEQLRPEIALEAKAELLNLELPTLDIEETQTRLSALQAAAKTNSNRHTRVRLAEIASAAATFEGAATGQLDLLYDAARSLRDVADDWELAGERARAAATLRLLVSSPLMHLGRYQEGIGVAERALALTHDQPNGHTKSMALLVFLTSLSGDSDAFQAAIAQQDRIETSRISFEWTDAYRRWSEMWMGAFDGHVDVVRQAQRETRARLGDLFRHQTGSVFLCDTAVCLALVGDRGNALSALDEARNRADVEPLELGIAEITVEARLGDADRARKLVAQLHQTVDVPAERSWRLELEVALGEFRHTETWNEDQAQAIMHEANRFGLSTLASRLLARAGRAADPRLRLEVFGQFGAFRGTSRIEVPAGNTSALIKLLAVRDRPVHVDVVVDHLWPEADPTRGRNRLRNCVNRARVALGHEAIVRDDQTLALAPTVETDLRDFHAATATTAGDPNHVPSMLQALEIYKDHLLATDLYSDWLLPERESYRSTAETIIVRLLSGGHVPVADLLTDALRLGATPSVLKKIEYAANEQNDPVTAMACRAGLHRNY